MEQSLRHAVYAQLSQPDPSWDGLLTEMTDTKQKVLVRLMERGTDLVVGSTADRLHDLTEEMGLRQQARSLIESDDRADRLAGLSLFIEFGWKADPEWLVEETSSDQAEIEAVVHVLANASSPLTRVIGINLAIERGILSVYGTHGLFRLLREDPDLLLERLNRDGVQDPELLVPLLRILTHSKRASEQAPVAAVIANLEHESPLVRGAACGVLGKYGWRGVVRDQVDLIVDELFDDESAYVRIKVYEMLGRWGDAAARAKLAFAAESETNSRALFTIARNLGERDSQSFGPRGDHTLARRFSTWAEVSALDTIHQPLPP
ncbi:MAG: HEAT repeat domain-containing protein [Haloarculaceae archaeon]